MNRIACDNNAKNTIYSVIQTREKVKVMGNAMQSHLCGT